MKCHKTTIFLRFSYDFPMEILWFSYGFPMSHVSSLRCFFRMQDPETADGTPAPSAIAVIRSAPWISVDISHVRLYIYIYIYMYKYIYYMHMYEKKHIYIYHTYIVN